MKRTSFLLIIALLLSTTATAQQAWQGRATRGNLEDFPSQGYYAASNSFPRNSIVTVKNMLNGKTVRVVISRGLNDESFLLSLSSEAARAIDLEAGTALSVSAQQLLVPGIADSGLGDERAFSNDPDLAYLNTTTSTLARSTTQTSNQATLANNANQASNRQSDLSNAQALRTAPRNQTSGSLRDPSQTEIIAPAQNQRTEIVNNPGRTAGSGQAISGTVTTLAQNFVSPGGLNALPAVNQQSQVAADLVTQSNGEQGPQGVAAIPADSQNANSARGGTNQVQNLEVQPAREAPALAGNQNIVDPGQMLASRTGNPVIRDPGLVNSNSSGNSLSTSPLAVEQGSAGREPVNNLAPQTGIAASVQNLRRPGNVTTTTIVGTQVQATISDNRPSSLRSGAIAARPSQSLTGSQTGTRSDRTTPSQVTQNTSGQARQQGDTVVTEARPQASTGLLNGVRGFNSGTRDLPNPGDVARPEHLFTPPQISQDRSAITSGQSPLPQTRDIRSQGNNQATIVANGGINTENPALLSSQMAAALPENQQIQLFRPYEQLESNDLLRPGQAPTEAGLALASRLPESRAPGVLVPDSSLRSGSVPRTGELSANLPSSQVPGSLQADPSLQRGIAPGSGELSANLPSSQLSGNTVPETGNPWLDGGTGLALSGVNLPLAQFVPEEVPQLAFEGALPGLTSSLPADGLPLAASVAGYADTSSQRLNSESQELTANLPQPAKKTDTIPENPVNGLRPQGNVISLEPADYRPPTLPAIDRADALVTIGSPGQLGLQDTRISQLPRLQTGRGSGNAEPGTVPLTANQTQVNGELSQPGSPFAEPGSNGLITTPPSNGTITIDPNRPRVPQQGQISVTTSTTIVQQNLTLIDADKRPPLNGNLQVTGDTILLGNLPDEQWARANLPLISSLLDNKYYLQLGSYANPRSARQAMIDVAPAYPFVVVPEKSSSRHVYKVFVGPLQDDEKGMVLYMFRAKGFKDAFIRKSQP